MKHSRSATVLLLASLLGGCDFILGPENWDFLELDAAVEFSPDSISLFTHLHITNRSSKDWRLVEPGCTPGIGVSLVDEVGDRAWNYSAIERAEETDRMRAEGKPIACAPVDYARTIAPGGTLRRSLRLDVSRVLGDSLSEGRYRVLIRPEFAQGGGPRGQPELVAGEVELRR